MLCRITSTLSQDHFFSQRVLTELTQTLEGAYRYESSWNKLLYNLFYILTLPDDVEHCMRLGVCQTVRYQYLIWYNTKANWLNDSLRQHESGEEFRAWCMMSSGKEIWR